MDDEIEETQRQLRHSAALIQDAFQGLRTLNSRVSEASTMRMQARSTDPPLPRAPIPQHITTVGPVPPEDESASRRTMDPGHDVIVISYSDPIPIPSTSASPPSLPASAETSTSPRRPRTIDSTLLSLRSELLASTASVRERASELDELRRSIVQYTNERNAARAGGTSPPSTETPSGPREGGGSSGTNQSPSRRMLLDYSLRQRAASESATSLGMLVAARSSSPPSNANNTTTNLIVPAPAAPEFSTASTALIVPTSPTTDTARSTSGPVPAVIASRVSRLAQEIQQDIARITQQSESLMSWINEHRSRLDASSSRASGSAHAPTNRDIASRRATFGTNTGSSTSNMSVPVAPSDPLPTTSTSDIVLAPSLGLAITSASRSTIPSRSDAATPTPRRRASEAGARPGVHAHDSAPQSMPTPLRPRRAPEATVRARYLRQNVPSSWNAIPPSPSSPREERSSSWTVHTQRQDGPLSLPTRTVNLPGDSGPTSRTAEAGTSSRSVFEDEELLETTSRVRIAMARAQLLRRGAAFDDEDDTESRNYRVRRRYNADGDEEVVRVTLRPELSPGFGETASERAREEMDEGEEDEEENEAWIQALSRLDAMSRETARREAAAATAARSRLDQPRWETARRGYVRAAVANTGSAEAGASAFSYSSFPRLARGWPRLTARGDETSAEEADYERDVEAMRARARSLISATAGPRTLGGATLPPPPPTTRPLSFVPTTQGTPGSLWNDSNVRVRLRAAAERLEGDMRRVLDAARDRDYTPFSLPSPSPPLARPSHDSSRGQGGTRAANQRADKDLEQPMWGSPMPFYPSALPLPLVEDIGSLHVRSRAFTGARKFARMPRRRVLAEAGR